MDYIEWAKEYESDAARIKKTIDRKKDLLHNLLPADQRHQISLEIISFRCIYRELLSTVRKLREKGKKQEVK